MGDGKRRDGPFLLRFASGTVRLRRCARISEASTESRKRSFSMFSAYRDARSANAKKIAHG